MKTQTGGIARDQKAGGWAALYLAAAYLVAMPYFLVFSDYQSVTAPAKKVAVLVAEQDGMRVMELVTYVLFGVVLAVLALALHRRLKAGAPLLAQTATVVGLVWAVMLVAGGLVFNAGVDAVVGLSGSYPAQAAAVWQAVEPVSQGLGGAGGELLGGLWVLLVSVAALRTRTLSRPLVWLGVVVGGAGLLSVAPPLRDLAYLFGVLQIAWLAWLGVALLRTAPLTAGAAAHDAAPARDTAGARPVRLAAQRDAS